MNQPDDAALALERVRVHHALIDDLVLAEGPGLAEHLVDEGRLPVIDVRDDGNIADFHSL